MYARVHIIQLRGCSKLTSGYLGVTPRSKWVGQFGNHTRFGQLMTNSSLRSPWSVTRVAMVTRVSRSTLVILINLATLVDLVTLITLVALVTLVPLVTLTSDHPGRP